MYVGVKRRKRKLPLFLLATLDAANILLLTFQSSLSRVGGGAHVRRCPGKAGHGELR